MPSNTDPGGSTTKRTIGLTGSIGIGVGAIVGGGILALAGAAFASTGPSAVLAFGLNGVIAVLTALSFAELSTAFPRSGGAYTFARKVLSVRAAFGVGWVLWFAYIVAAVLYALGFAEFGRVMVVNLWRAVAPAAGPPAWLESRGLVRVVAVASVLAYSVGLARRPPGGGLWASWAKVVVFVVLLVAGAVLLPRTPADILSRGLTPFFAGGFVGLVQAMGVAFIALQGFEVIAAVAGEVKRPRWTIPRGMLASLGIALVIYLPLLLLTATIGVPAGSSVGELATRDPETVMAVAVRNYLGLPGYWLVMVAAVLSMLSALQANLLAASHISLSMARERTLPSALSRLHATRNTPVTAVAATALAVVAIVLVVPDLASAGAAASLIFLISFALAHVMAGLARIRGGAARKAFRTPAFPLVPIVGAVACSALALFQTVTVPSAGALTAVWLGFGALLYVALFRDRAEVVDALAEAHDPELARLRGRSPLVLVPVARPESAAGLVALGNAMAPPVVGRVLLLSVVTPPPTTEDDDAGRQRIRQALRAGEQVLHEALSESLAAGDSPEALITIAADPWGDIARVARAHQCESIVLGLSDLDTKQPVDHLESLINDVGSDAAILWGPPGFQLDDVRRVLVPAGGKGGQDELRARILGSLCRRAEREIVYIRVLGGSPSQEEREDARQALQEIAAEEAPGSPRAEVLASREPVEAIVQRARSSDLLVLGLARTRGRRSFGRVGLAILRHSPCATLLISRR